MTEYAFTISYYSEASAVLTFERFTEARELPEIELRVRHPKQKREENTRVSLHDWYWFAPHSKDVIRKKYPRELNYSYRVGDSEREAVLQCLHWAAEDLWPGPGFFFEPGNNVGGVEYHDERKRYDQFRQDLLYAFVLGGLAPVAKHQEPVPEPMWVDAWRAEHWDTRHDPTQY